MKKKFLLTLAVITVLGLLGCQKETEYEVPIATPTVEAVKEPEATATVESTATPETTAASEPTATPELTAAPEPTATPELTAAPEPTATPEPTQSVEEEEPREHESVDIFDGTFWFDNELWMGYGFKDGQVIILHSDITVFEEMPRASYVIDENGYGYVEEWGYRFTIKNGRLCRYTDEESISDIEEVIELPRSSEEEFNNSEEELTTSEPTKAPEPTATPEPTQSVEEEEPGEHESVDIFDGTFWFDNELWMGYGFKDGQVIILHSDITVFEEMPRASYVIDENGYGYVEEWGYRFTIKNGRLCRYTDEESISDIEEVIELPRSSEEEFNNSGEELTTSEPTKAPEPTISITDSDVLNGTYWIAQQTGNVLMFQDGVMNKNGEYFCEYGISRDNNITLINSDNISGMLEEERGFLFIWWSVNDIESETFKQCSEEDYKARENILTSIDTPVPTNVPTQIEDVPALERVVSFENIDGTQWKSILDEDTVIFKDGFMHLTSDGEMISIEYNIEGDELYAVRTDDGVTFRFIFSSNVLELYFFNGIVDIPMNSFEQYIAATDTSDAVENTENTEKTETISEDVFDGTFWYSFHYEDGYCFKNGQVYEHGSSDGRAYEVIEDGSAYVESSGIYLRIEDGCLYLIYEDGSETPSDLYYDKCSEIEYFWEMPAYSLDNKYWYNSTTGEGVFTLGNCIYENTDIAGMHVRSEGDILIVGDESYNECGYYILEPEEDRLYFCENAEKLNDWNKESADTYYEECTRYEYFSHYDNSFNDTYWYNEEDEEAVYFLNGYMYDYDGYWSTTEINMDANVGFDVTYNDYYYYIFGDELFILWYLCDDEEEIRREADFSYKRCTKEEFMNVNSMSEDDLKNCPIG